MKKLLFLSVFLLFFAGCGRDASQLTVVTGISVDGFPGEYQVGTEVIRLTGNDQNSQSVLLQADGHTISDGIDSLVSMTGRSLYSNHAQVLIIGRHTAESDIAVLMEELMRVNQYPLSLRVAVAKGTAAKIMEAKPVVSDLHSVELEDMIREGASQCLTADMNVCSFYQDMRMPGIEGILPFMELREDHGEQVCTLAGTALFRDTALVAVLNREDSRTLMWMRGKSGGTMVTRHGLVEMTYLDRKLEVDGQRAKLTLHLTLTASGSEDNEAALINETQHLMNARCRSLITQLQALNCDAVGFGEQLYRHHPHEWNRLLAPWSQMFAKYPVEIEVRVENVIWGRIWSAEGITAGEEGESRGT